MRTNVAVVEGLVGASSELAAIIEMDALSRRWKEGVCVLRAAAVQHDSSELDDPGELRHTSPLVRARSTRGAEIGRGENQVSNDTALVREYSRAVSLPSRVSIRARPVELLSIFRVSFVTAGLLVLEGRRRWSRALAQLAGTRSKTYGTLTENSLYFAKCMAIRTVQGS